MSIRRTTTQRAARTVAGATALVGIALTAAPIVIAAGKAPGYHSVDALLAATGVMLLITAVLLLPTRTVKVAHTDAKLRWKDSDNAAHQILDGWLVSDTVYANLLDSNDNPIDDDRKKALVRDQWVSALRTMYRGKDNRASTSKSVALAWTYAIVWGLLALLALKLMGSGASWDKLTGGGGLQEDYLLLLGGPYAAVVIAKYTAVAGAASDTKTSDPNQSPSLTADAKNLIADDVGDTDLGDLQYVLFNLVALAFFYGAMIPHPGRGFPTLPSLLVGLALTSAATYTAKKVAVSAVGPQLNSIFPTSIPAGKDATVDLYGRYLVSDGTPPAVTVGAYQVGEVQVIKTAGTGDHVKFTLPAGSLAAADSYPVRAIDLSTGASAVGPGGGDSISLGVV